MRVFLSWSGRSSRQVAEALHDWLPRVIQAVRPWLSAQDIDAGARWSDDLARELQSNAFGVLCVTRENMEKPWLLFEAGALSRTIQSARVCPFLLGLRSADLVGPLAQFQAVEAEEEHLLMLVASINRALGDNRLPDDQLEESFRIWWPRLRDKLNAIGTSLAANTVVEPPRRAVDDMVAEILEIVRSQRRDIIEAEVVAEPVKRATLTARILAAKFPPGCRVIHPQFGVGEVMTVEPVDDDVKVTAKFDSVGVKVLRQKFARLQRAD
jgi:hypothetical protein